MDAGRDLKRARRAAHLTQRQLADRSGIDQADTLERLLRATGHRYELVAETPVDVDRAALRALLALGDVERERYFLRSNANMLALMAEAKRSP
jgi:transcriptional regulator with XRE-family HTH domain